ncbi:unnamed protein product [Durusdinium trenchii]|uniref:Uncharacterized protein n=2 Tax=Durusdinium trenchii TaxID=1381693 RepID=A0ABP0ISP7_9DINO
MPKLPQVTVKQNLPRRKAAHRAASKRWRDKWIRKGVPRDSALASTGTETDTPTQEEEQPGGQCPASGRKRKDTPEEEGQRPQRTPRPAAARRRATLKSIFATS